MAKKIEKPEEIFEEFTSDYKNIFKEDLLSNIISCLIQISILLIFFIPFLIVLERQTNIFSLAKNIIARK